MTTARLIKMGKKLVSQSIRDRHQRQKWDVHQVIWPFRVLFHPINGYQEIKWEHQGSVRLSLVIAVLLFISQVFDTTNTAFIFNYARPGTLDLRFEFAMSVLPIVLWCISNWSVTSLMDGKGNFREIWIYSFYAAMPILITKIPLALLSRLLTSEESAIFSLLNGVVVLWVCLLFFIGNMIIHQYSFKMTIVSILLTFFGIAVILFLMVLLFSLFQQFGTFVSTIYKELLFRL